MGQVDYIHPRLVGVANGNRERGRKLDNSGGGRLVQEKRKMGAEKNRETDPQLRFMEKFGEFFKPACHEGHL